MTTYKKILALTLVALTMMGCTVSLSTTNTHKGNGEVEVTKAFKVTKNNDIIKVVGTVAAVAISSKLDAAGLLVPALLDYDIQSKNHKLEQEKLRKAQEDEASSEKI